MKENFNPLLIMLWLKDRKYNLTLNKEKNYQLEDVRKYLIEKNPNNEFIKGMSSLIEELFIRLIMGDSLIEVDEGLYSLNSNAESLRVSKTEQRLKFIEKFNERIGADVYWYSLLKQVIRANKKSKKFDRDEIYDRYLQVANELLIEKTNVSLNELDQNIITGDFKSLKKGSLFQTGLNSKFEHIKELILNFRKYSEFRVFQAACVDNNYEFYYENLKDEEFLKDSIAFSINLSLQRVLKEQTELFEYEFRKSTSLYPEDFINHPEGTLIVCITPFGFYSFDEIDKIYAEDSLEKTLKDFLSRDFEIVDRLAVYDYDAYINGPSKLDSSFILGKDLKYQTYWGKRSKDYVDKLISGTIWLYSDAFGNPVTSLSLHPDNKFKKNNKYILKAKDLIFYYSELRLENINWKRNRQDILESGYLDKDPHHLEGEYGDEYDDGYGDEYGDEYD